MKKFLLTFVLSIIWFIGFSSATSITCIQWSSCNPENIVFPNWAESFVINMVSTDVDDPLYSFWMKWTNDYEVYYTYWNPWVVYNVSDFWDGFSISAFNSDEGSTQTFDIVYTVPVVPGRSSAFTPVISSVFNVIWQFIPYVVYIWIWILLCTLWFYVIKWLVNWLTSKITNYFK